MSGLVCLSIVACAQPPETPPNVLIVLVDVLRRDHLGAYGYSRDTSPHIDAFAAESFRFETMYSHSTWTKPSVATLFTSVYPDQHGLGRVGFEEAGGFHTDVLPEQLVTLAEVFQASGYRTGSVGANVHIQDKTGFAQGFDGFWMQRLTKGRALNEQLQKWLDIVDREGPPPFFAYLHYMDVHWPYTRSLSDKDFGPTGFRRRPPHTWTAVPAWAEKYLDEKGIAAITARYDHEVAYVDLAFGELLEDLSAPRRAGRDDRGLSGGSRRGPVRTRLLAAFVGALSRSHGDPSHHSAATAIRAGAGDVTGDGRLGRCHADRTRPGRAGGAGRNAGAQPGAADVR